MRERDVSERPGPQEAALLLVGPRLRLAWVALAGPPADAGPGGVPAQSMSGEEAGPFGVSTRESS
jgi:hypothetical protein